MKTGKIEYSPDYKSEVRNPLDRLKTALDRAPVKKDSLRWTQEKPTEDGLYWYQAMTKTKPVLLEMRKGMACIINTNIWQRLDTAKGYYYGPIQPPEFNL
jgi:hypothetical protein